MRRYIIAITWVVLVSCTKGLPPLRTWEMGKAHAGSNKVEFSFTAPYRDPPKGYWDYKLGIVLPKGVNFNLSGEVKIYSQATEAPVRSIRFDSAVESSWLGDKSNISHLLTGDLGIEDGKAYHVDVMFDHALDMDTSVVLHFLSHTNTPHSPP